MHQILLMSEALQNEQEKKHLKIQPLAQILETPDTANPHNQSTVFNGKQAPPSFQDQHLFTQKDYCDPDIKAYFNSKITKNDESKSMALNIIDEKVTLFKDCIKQGFISISGESKSVTDILNKSSHIAKEQQKLNQYINQKSQLEKELRRMQEAIKSANKDYTNLGKRSAQSGGTSLSQQQHKNFMERITQIKKQIDERKKIRAQYEMNSMKQIQKKKAQILKQKQQKLQKEKRNQAKQHLQMILKRRQKMNEQKAEAEKRFKSVSEQKRLHQHMEQEYRKNIYLPIIEERNKVLVERSKRLKEIKVEELLDYQRQYLKKKQQRQQNLRIKINQNWDYKHPPYSSKMMRILQEERIAQKIREEQQKRRIQQLKSRQQNYKQYLKEKFSTVKIDEKKRLEMSTIINKEKTKKKPNSVAFIKDIGNKYLSEAKSKIKNISKDKKESLSTNQQINKKTKSRQSYNIKPRTSMSKYQSSLSSEIEHNKIDQIVTSRSISENQKMKKLQFEIERLSEKAQRKQLFKKVNSKQKITDQEDLDNILSSIKAKMSFIELCKK